MTLQIKENHQQETASLLKLARLGVPRGAIGAFCDSLALSARAVAETISFDEKENPGIYSSNTAGMIQSWQRRVNMEKRGFHLADLPGGAVAYHYGSSEVLLKPMRVRGNSFRPTANPMPYIVGSILLGYDYDLSRGEDSGVTQLWVAKVTGVSRTGVSVDDKLKLGANSADMAIDWVYKAPIPLLARVQSSIG